MLFAVIQVCGITWTFSLLMFILKYMKINMGPRTKPWGHLHWKVVDYIDWKHPIEKISALFTSMAFTTSNNGNWFVGIGWVVYQGKVDENHEISIVIEQTEQFLTTQLEEYLTLIMFLVKEQLSNTLHRFRPFLGKSHTMSHFRDKRIIRPFILGSTLRAESLIRAELVRELHVWPFH